MCSPFILHILRYKAINALILPHLDYYNSVWDCLSSQLSDKLQELQNRAARVIMKSPFDTSTSPLLNKLKWQKLSIRRQKQKALVMYKTMHKLAQEYLRHLFTQHHAEYNLRNLKGENLVCPSRIRII